MKLLRRELPDAALLFISHQRLAAELGAEQLPLTDFIAGS